MRKTTIGWSILVKLKNGGEQWVPLRIMKLNYPIEIAEYAVSREISDEPAFCWWVPFTLRKRDTIVSSIRARIAKSNYKYGIKIPKTIKEALTLDAENGNTLWRDSIDLEMNTILPAFDILSYGEKVPPGYVQSSGHIIFDVKTDFTHKSRWVKDGNLTSYPIESDFAGVITCESVRIAFTYAALNGLDVYAADIKSAYVRAPTSEKHFIVCGDEFPLEYRGCDAIIKRDLYGGKCAGADYWKHMRTCMQGRSRPMDEESS